MRSVGEVGAATVHDAAQVDERRARLHHDGLRRRVARSGGRAASGASPARPGWRRPPRRSRRGRASTDICRSMPRFWATPQLQSSRCSSWRGVAGVDEDRLGLAEPVVAAVREQQAVGDGEQGRVQQVVADERRALAGETLDADGLRAVEGVVVIGLEPGRRASACGASSSSRRAITLGSRSSSITRPPSRRRMSTILSGSVSGWSRSRPSGRAKEEVCWGVTCMRASLPVFAVASANPGAFHPAGAGIPLREGIRPGTAGWRSGRG